MECRGILVKFNTYVIRNQLKSVKYTVETLVKKKKIARILSFRSSSCY